MNKRTKVSLSNYKLLSMNMGKLVPVNCVEVLPGDTWRGNSTAFIRVSPLNAPVMHPVHAKLYHFFVPYRLLWTNWEKFITGGEDGTFNTRLPYMQVGSEPLGGLIDYMGVPPYTGVPSTQEFSALPIRAYNKIIEDYFRDQDLSAHRVISLADGPDTTTTRTLASKCWEKDRFTTARPTPQKGADVLIPMGDTASIVDPNIVSDGTTPNFVPQSGPAFTDGGLAFNTNTVTRFGPKTSGSATTDTHTKFGNNTGLEIADDEIDLDGVAGTIRELREAVAIQRFRDRMSRAGSRYVDYLKSSFGVRSSDARLQRAELLGMGSQVVQFSEVLQTGVDDGGDPGEGVGNLLGHGIGNVRSNRYQKFFEEHGVVISLLCVIPKTMYVQGMEKFWLRQSREDFYDKDLAMIGEEAVSNAELFPQSTGVFGYQQRYYDYHDALSTIAGEFRTTVANFWHMARSFSSTPTLNESFVAADPTDRIYQSTNTDELYVMVNNSIQARRPIRRNTAPSIL